MSTSHDWARELQETALFLLSKDEVEIGNIPMTHFTTYVGKKPFLNLVRALKPGRKKTSEFFITFYPTGAEHLELVIDRNSICKRLNPEYECTPLLSKEEDAEMEAQS